MAMTETRSAKRKRTDHGPSCIACTDPETARRQMAEDRTELDAAASRAREHRQNGEAARERMHSADVGSSEFAAIQKYMIHELGAANGIFQTVNMHRAQLDRVAKAHGFDT
jgi:hypothetical protein